MYSFPYKSRFGILIDHTFLNILVYMCIKGRTLNNTFLTQGLLIQYFDI